MYYINVTWNGGLRETLDKRRKAQTAIELRQELQTVYKGLFKIMMIETRPVKYELSPDEKEIIEKVWNDEADYFGIDRPGF